MKKQFLEIGKIVGTHGLKGEVRVDAWCDSPNFLCRFKRLYKKDGTEIQLFELPYARTKKNYYEYVYPLINEIRIKSKDIAMEGPGEFYK